MTERKVVIPSHGSRPIVECRPSLFSRSRRWCLKGYFHIASLLPEIYAAAPADLILRPWFTVCVHSIDLQTYASMTTPVNDQLKLRDFINCEPILDIDSPTKRTPEVRFRVACARSRFCARRSVVRRSCSAVALVQIRARNRSGDQETRMSRSGVPSSSSSAFHRSSGLIPSASADICCSRESGNDGSADRSHAQTLSRVPFASFRVA